MDPESLKDSISSTRSMRSSRSFRPGRSGQPFSRMMARRERVEREFMSMPSSSISSRSVILVDGGLGIGSGVLCGCGGLEDVDGGERVVEAYLRRCLSRTIVSDELERCKLSRRLVMSLTERGRVIGFSGPAE